VWCWGQNGSGQSGSGTTGAKTTPVQVKNTTAANDWFAGATQISSGIAHTCALKSDGNVWCWGGNGTYGALGIGTTTGNFNLPQHVQNNDGSGYLTGASEIAAGPLGACAIVSGEVWCWGSNAYGEIGIGTCQNNGTTIGGTPCADTHKSRPQHVLNYSGGSGTYLSGISHLASGYLVYCGVRSGALYCWGWANNGQLGNNAAATSSSALIPAQVHGVGNSGFLSGVADVYGGRFTMCAKSTTGTGWCWGYNTAGATGDGSTLNGSTMTRLTPVVITNVGGTGTLTGISSMSSSPIAEHFMALR
jgi:alpha-tubulin suppressor-like RCC1 family protein